MAVRAAQERLRKEDETRLSYSGPSLTEVHTLRDEKVSEELLRLGVEPWKLPYVEDDEMLVAAYGDKDFDHTWTKAELKALRQKVYAWHRQCLKAQLHSAYIADWIATLSESACWTIVEEFEHRKVALSEKRYTSRDMLRTRTGWAISALERQRTTTEGGPNE